MTGYLQRLAAGAGPARSRIRPVVDPLYADGAGRPGLEEAPGDLAPETESLLVARSAPPEPAAASWARGGRESLGAGEARAAAPAAEGRLGRGEQDRRGFATGHPRREELAAPSAFAPRAPEADLGGTAPNSALDGADEAPRGFEFRAAASASEKEDRAPPLVRRPSAWPADQRDATETPRRSARDSGQRTAPDEIRIHVGRVEVAAAARPQPSAPAPARKAMSLEDYLRRVSARRR